MSYHYERYFARVTALPWAITPAKLDELQALAGLLARGGRVTDEEIAARFGDASDRTSRGSRSDRGVAVVPVYGTLLYRGDSFSRSSGGVSAEALRRVMTQLAGDEAVTAIVLDIDSPGGSVDGLPEAAAAIRAAAAEKPVVAQVNTDAASGAYWLASQASEIVITPSGRVGSIGVFMVHLDKTRALEQDGITVNEISAGKFKTEGAPWRELEKDSRAFLQGQVDDWYRQFVAAVATGRGITPAKVRETYGQGRMFFAPEALSRGMVDRVATLEETLDRLSGNRRLPLGRGRTSAAVAQGRADRAHLNRMLAEADRRHLDRILARSDRAWLDRLSSGGNS